MVSVGLGDLRVFPCLCEWVTCGPSNVVSVGLGDLRAFPCLCEWVT